MPGSAVRTLISPGQRIGAVGGALRPAQHLDLPRVEQRRRHADAGEIDIVDQKAHRRIGRPLILLHLADAAQLEKSRPRRARRPVQIRDQAENVLEMLHPGRSQGIGIEDGDALRQFGDAWSNAASR